MASLKALPWGRPTERPKLWGGMSVRDVGPPGQVHNVIIVAILVLTVNRPPAGRYEVLSRVQQQLAITRGNQTDQASCNHHLSRQQLYCRINLLVYYVLVDDASIVRTELQSLKQKSNNGSGAGKSKSDEVLHSFELCRRS
jgi:hypothetical protein